jgi:hypothetical protein
MVVQTGILLASTWRQRGKEPGKELVGGRLCGEWAKGEGGGMQGKRNPTASPRSKYPLVCFPLSGTGLILGLILMMQLVGLDPFCPGPCQPTVIKSQIDTIDTPTSYNGSKDNAAAVVCLF